MNKFFAQYVDLTAVALTFLVPLLLTILLKRKSGRKTRAIPVYFLLFGPAGILVFIFFHLFENSYRAIVAAVNSSFIYNFHFYSLILLGGIVACTSYLLLKACWFYCILEKNNKTKIFKLMLLIGVVTLPLIPITPLGAVPGICCVFSLSGLPFARKKRKNVPVIHLEKEQELLNAK